MGFHTFLFGDGGENALRLLASLGLTKEDFGRYRDCFVTTYKSQKAIGVYTRCGGPNRAGYPEVFEKMEKHALFMGILDRDDDETYCTFYFRFPENGDIADIEPSPTPEQKFQDLINRLNSSSS